MAKSTKSPTKSYTRRAWRSLLSCVKAYPNLISNNHGPNQLPLVSEETPEFTVTRSAWSATTKPLYADVAWGKELEGLTIIPLTHYKAIPYACPYLGQFQDDQSLPIIPSNNVFYYDIPEKDMPLFLEKVDAIGVPNGNVDATGVVRMVLNSNPGPSRTFAKTDPLQYQENGESLHMQDLLKFIKTTAKEHGDIFEFIEGLNEGSTGPCWNKGLPDVLPSILKQYAKPKTSYDKEKWIRSIRKVVAQIGQICLKEHGTPTIPLLDWGSNGYSYEDLLNMDDKSLVWEAIYGTGALGVTVKNSNKGYPTFEKQINDPNDESKAATFYRESLKLAKHIWDHGHSDLPFMLLTRTQNSKGEGDGEPGDRAFYTKNKVRQVNAGPYASFIAEGRFLRPLRDVMRKHPYWCGYEDWESSYRLDNNRGTKHVIGEYMEVFADFSENSIYGLLRRIFSSLDYIGFDGTIGDPLQPIWDELKVLFEEEAHPIIDSCKHWYLTAPLITPFGIIFGEHGLFSGAFGTSFMGSLLNACAAEYVLDEHCEGAMYFTHGDDCVALFTLKASSPLNNLTDDEITKYLAKEYKTLGMDLSTDPRKSALQTVTPNPTFPPYITFLAKYMFWDPGKPWHLEPISSASRIAGKLIHPERVEPIMTALKEIDRNMFNTLVLNPESDDEDMILSEGDITTVTYFSKIISILLNLLHSPYMEDVVKYIIDRSPFFLSPLYLYRRGETLWAKQSLLRDILILSLDNKTHGKTHEVLEFITTYSCTKEIIPDISYVEMTSCQITTLIKSARQEKKRRWLESQEEAKLTKADAEELIINSEFSNETKAILLEFVDQGHTTRTRQVGKRRAR